MIVLAGLCVGCPHPVLSPDRNLKEYIQESDIVGEWFLQPASLALLARDGFETNAAYRYNIQFMTNGGCVFQSVVTAFKGGAYFDIAGIWRLEHDTTGGSDIKVKNAIRLELPLPNTTHLSYLHLDKREAALVLWSFYGDPDSWEFMEYKRAEQGVAGYSAQSALSPER